MATKDCNVNKSAEAEQKATSREKLDLSEVENLAGGTGGDDKPIELPEI